MAADGCFGALKWSFHRAQMIKPASARRDHERRAKKMRRELGSLGQFRTAGDS
jgi:hypothetical protein